MTECFRCGDDEHLSHDCPRHTREQAGTRRPLWPSGQRAEEEEKTPQSGLPAYNQGVPPRKDPSEIADASSWAESIREIFGWDKDAATRRQRRIAAEQVTASRLEHW